MEPDKLTEEEKPIQVYLNKELNDKLERLRMFFGSRSWADTIRTLISEREIPQQQQSSVQQG